MMLSRSPICNLTSDKAFMQMDNTYFIGEVFSKVNRNGKILFSSLKGGVGKSTAACAVAMAFAEAGFNTVIVDLDFRSRSLDLIFGVPDRALYTFDDYLNERCSADEVLIPIEHDSTRKKNSEKTFSLRLCPACTEASFTDENLYKMIPTALNKLALESDADYIICDTGADSRVPYIVADGFSEVALIVAEQSRTSIRAADATAEKLSECHTTHDVRLLINNFDIDAVRRMGRAGIIEMIDACRVRCIGVIPHDPHLAAFQDKGCLPDSSSSVSAAAANIAGRLRGIQTPLFDGMKKQRRKAVL